MTSLTKICLHWTGGNNYPCDTDLTAYHYCVDKDGKIYKGKYPPEDNLNYYDWNYAKHCGGGNTGCIGISLCAMAGFNLSKKQTKDPITQKQLEAFCLLAAYLCSKYGIIISEKTVFTHYEFDQRRIKNKQEGKTDITYINYFPNLTINSAGNYLRNKTDWYKNKLEENRYTLEKKGEYYEFIILD